MNTLSLKLSLKRLAIVATTTLLLAACGGGDNRPVTASTATASAAEFARMMASAGRPDGAAVSSGRLKALSFEPVSTSATVAISNAQLFEWAQLTYPELFGNAPPAVIANLVFEGKIFDVRDFGNGNYLGVSNGRAYGYGNFTGLQLVDYGAVQEYAAQVCAVLRCSGPGTGPGGPAGPLNECVDPALSSLPTGFRIDLVYTYSGLVSGEQRTSSVITGPATFKGQNAVLITSTTTGTNTFSSGGFSITTTTQTLTRSYEQPGTGGLIRSLGSIIEATTTTSSPFPGFPGSSDTNIIETVFNPPSENIEFTISVGQSINVTDTFTTTQLSPPTAIPPQTVTSTETYTFEGKETITVPAGTFNTCRYRVTSAGVNGYTLEWIIVGRGIGARFQDVDSAGTQLIELKSGSYNGGPL